MRIRNTSVNNPTVNSKFDMFFPCCLNNPGKKRIKKQKQNNSRIKYDPNHSMKFCNDCLIQRFSFVVALAHEYGSRGGEMMATNTTVALLGKRNHGRREKPSPRMNNPNKMIAHCQNTKPGFSDSIFSTSSFEAEGMPKR